MYNDFDNKIKWMEKEVLALKTASNFSSTRSSNTTTAVSVSSGLYKITYEDGPYPIMAFAYRKNFTPLGVYALREPSSNEQLLEIGSIPSPNDVYIVSNRPVVNITKIQ